MDNFGSVKLWVSSSSSSILLTDIYKGWRKSQPIITDTNIVHLTGYLKHVIDDAMAHQIYIQSAAGGNDTVNNQYGRISPCGDCQGSRSSTDSCRIDNHRHPTIDPTVAATAPSSQCRIKVNKHTVPHYYIAVRVGVSVITHVYPDEWNVWLWLGFTEVCSQGPINNISALVQIMAWWPPGHKPPSEPMMVSLLTHVFVTQPQRVKASYIDTNLLTTDVMILVERIKPRRDGCQEAIGDSNDCRADWH